MAAMRMAYESFRTWSAVVAAVLLLATFAAGPAHAQNGEARYYALVIGNNDYQHLPDLETAVSDAAAAAELLRSKYGFEIKLMLNATRAELLAEMNRLQGELEDADRLLIYYAGHGILDRVTQTGYWLPTDAREDDDTNWIPNSQLSRYLQRMAARHVMVVADSCYSGTLSDIQTAIELYTPLYALFLPKNDFVRAVNSLQLDEVIAIYIAKVLDTTYHLGFIKNGHPLVPLSTFQAGFRLMLHGLDAEALHGWLRQMKASGGALDKAL